MSTATTHPAKGKIIRQVGQFVTFRPANTNYELDLLSGGEFKGALESPVEATIFVTARKVYTVPSGGNFIQPIFGTPRVIQGRVLSAAGNELIVHAGVAIAVALPAGESAIDLNNGAITEGSMVNVIAMPGASIEFRR